MKAPAFWWRERPGAAALGLAPLGAITGAVTALRMHRPGRDPGVPVFCIGNLVAGGAGKTPAAIALAQLLLADGRRPCFVSRGYGRQRGGSSSPIAVDPERHDAASVGDEPLLLARIAPTVVAADRIAAAEVAIKAGADCLVLDDGLQSPALAKSWTLAVVDGASGHGNSLCLPAGPLRAPAGLQWPMVSMLCVVGPGRPGERVTRSAQRLGVPMTRAVIVPDAAVLARWRSQPLFAFAGLGRPEKFFAMLRAAGLELAGIRAFPDHHRFTDADCARLRKAAGSALLVTTAKDRTRLPAGTPAEILPVELVFDQPERLRTALAACF